MLPKSFLFCWNCSSASVRTSSFILFSLQDIFIIFRYAHISNECNFVIFLVVIVHVSHPYKSVDHTYVCIFVFSYLFGTGFFSKRIECTSCNFNSFHNFIITFSICILYLRLGKGNPRNPPSGCPASHCDRKAR